MRRCAFLFLMLVFGVCVNVSAQKISISEKNISLNKIFSIIQEQSGYSILYDNQILKHAKNIDIEIRDASIGEVLDYCLRAEPLIYVITGKIIVIKEKEPADQKAISGAIFGEIKDESGNAITGASIIIIELRQGTVSDVSGDFSLVNIASGTYTIEVSFVGFNTERRTINVINTEPLRLHFKLQQAQTGLQEITVATALGITKKSRSLSYSIQVVNNSDLSTVKNTNVLNSLNGKVAGVQINRTSAGAGGSVRVVLRGDKSTRSSQPLYVIDGMPIVNPTGGPVSGLYNSAPDQGDILSTINPDDIENITVLKGASASALYGSQGSNGVIMITTKKGRPGRTKIDFSSSTSFDHAFIFPDLQFNYVQSTPQDAVSPGSDDSWGNKGAGSPDNNYVKNFFQTGNTVINSINFSTAKESSSNYFSYSNTENKGILPTSSFGQHTLGFRQEAKFLNDKLLLNASCLGSIQSIHNRATPGIYFNPLSGLYLFPRGLDFNLYKAYEYFSPSRYLYAQNWWNINTDKGWIGQDYQQNPYWVQNRNPVDNRNQNIYASLSLKYLLNNWISLQARGNVNNFINEYQRKIYATTQATLAKPNGTYSTTRNSNTTLYGDLLLTGDKKLGSDWGFGFTLGVSIQDQNGTSISVSGSPTVPDVFLESAIDRSTITITNSAVSREVQSVFGNVQLGFREKLFLDLSDRNDWSSTLAFTPAERTGFNYYSAGASGILSELFHLPDPIDLAKLRLSYAIVGNDIAPFSTYPLFTLSSGVANPPTSSPIRVPGYFLQPEKNRSLEIGTEWIFFKNRLSLDMTWYKSNITNQYFQGIPVAPGLGAGGFADINSGDIQNTGFEATVSGKIIDGRSFAWKTAVNFSFNRNKIKQLFNSDIVLNPSPNQIYPLTGTNGREGVLKQGGAYNDIYGRTFKRDASGHIVVSSLTGIPFFKDGQYLGNPNPRFILGLKNSFDWRSWSIGFLVDGKFGGKVLSISEAYFDQLGVSKRTGDARANGGHILIANAVDENGNPWKQTIDAKDYYESIGGKTPVEEAYMYSATAIRLREFSVAYHVPLKSKAVRDLKIGITGNNLFFFSRKAPFDPEQVAGVNPGGVGVDVFGLPAYRSIGFTFFLTF